MIKKEKDQRIKSAKMTERMESIKKGKPIKFSFSQNVHQFSFFFIDSKLSPSRFDKNT